MSRPIPLLFLALAALCFPAAAQPSQDPAKDVTAKDVDVRLAAMAALEQRADPADGKLVAKVLDDDDWEMVERAARLLGKLRYEPAVSELQKLALEGAVRRIRIAAAESLAELAPDDAFEDLLKKTSGDDGARACEALRALGPHVSEEQNLRALEKAVRADEFAVRFHAAAASIAVGGPELLERFGELLNEESPLGVRAGALEGAALGPDPRLVPPLLAFLGREKLDDTLERRARAAILACVTPAEGAKEASDGRAEALRAVFESAGKVEGVARPRFARLLGDFLDAAGSEALEAAVGPSKEGLTSWIKNGDAPTRAAALHALASSGAEGARDALLSAASGDSSERVRATAVRDLAPLCAKDDEVRTALASVLEKDGDAEVRIAAATALGVEKGEEGVEALIAALADPDWRVAASAAVSLGRVRAESGIRALIDLAKQSPDWRLRGAAVVGCGHAWDKAAVTSIVAAVGDADPSVQRAAHEILLRIARRDDLPRSREAWAAWWQENEKRVVMLDPKELADRRERYGYSRRPDEIFRGLDVLVLNGDIAMGEGDRMQIVLDQLDISYRMTDPGRIAEAELHPLAVFVANCTGTLGEGDAERLQWFVLTGGALMGSCWALYETIEKVAPGVVRRLPTRSEVLDDVTAADCDPDHPYMEGVFEGGVRPIYALVGAFLIDVLDPERAEVLIDSPECAERWGGGNLAAWFRVGHGVVFDSVNHFNHQGLEHATHLKKPEERMAFAVDHLGLGYAELRSLAEEKFWKKASEAARQVRDLSVFRLVTNFVRAKRIADA